ncbi:MAG: hypothetical protein RR595_03965 [Lysinibacillus sp.]
MKYCIYLKKSEPEVSFSSEEHIFPAGIGGIKKLPSEYVSDDCNNDFSSIELGFMRNSLISLPRQFFGPGKRGKLASRYATKSSISIVSNVDDPNEIELGYISLGKPYSISQIKVNINGTAKFISSSIDDATKQISDFSSNLTKFANKYILIKEEKFADDEFTLGFHEGNWYLGLSNEENQSQVSNFIQKIIDQKSFENKTPSVGTMQPKVKLSMQVDEGYFRICAKIIFNYIASIQGQDFALKKCFDPLRNWIVKGGENHFAELLSGQALFKGISFPPQAHKLIITKVDSSLIGYISFYGDSFSTIVYLCDDFTDPFEIEGFICDWENRREFRLLEYINTLHER